MALFVAVTLTACGGGSSKQETLVSNYEKAVMDGDFVLIFEIEKELEQLGPDAFTDAQKERLQKASQMQSTIKKKGSPKVDRLISQLEQAAIDSDSVRIEEISEEIQKLGGSNVLTESQEVRITEAIITYYKNKNQIH